MYDKFQDYIWKLIKLKTFFEKSQIQWKEYKYNYYIIKKEVEAISDKTEDFI